MKLNFEARQEVLKVLFLEEESDLNVSRTTEQTPSQINQTDHFTFGKTLLCVYSREKQMLCAETRFVMEAPTEG